MSAAKTTTAVVKTVSYNEFIRSSLVYRKPDKATSKPKAAATGAAPAPGATPGSVNPMMGMGGMPGANPMAMMGMPGGMTPQMMQMMQMQMMQGMQGMNGGAQTSEEVTYFFVIIDYRYNQNRKKAEETLTGAPQSGPATLTDVLILKSPILETPIGIIAKLRNGKMSYSMKLRLPRSDDEAVKFIAVLDAIHEDTVGFIFNHKTDVGYKETNGIDFIRESLPQIYFTKEGKEPALWLDLPNFPAKDGKGEYKPRFYGLNKKEMDWDMVKKAKFNVQATIEFRRVYFSGNNRRIQIKLKSAIVTTIPIPVSDINEEEEDIDQILALNPEQGDQFAAEFDRMMEARKIADKVNAVPAKILDPEDDPLRANAPNSAGATTGTESGTAQGAGVPLPSHHETSVSPPNQVIPTPDPVVPAANPFAIPGLPPGTIPGIPGLPGLPPA